MEAHQQALRERIQILRNVMPPDHEAIERDTKNLDEVSSLLAGGKSAAQVHKDVVELEIPMNARWALMMEVG